MSVSIFLSPLRCRFKNSVIHDIKTIRAYTIIPRILQGKCKESYHKLSIRNKSYENPTGTPGSGAGRGGGAGGSVRESGGGLGQFGAAQEEQFFFNKQREQLEKLKKKLKEGKAGELSQKGENYGKGCLVLKSPLSFSEINIRFYTDGPGKKPPKEEQIDSLKMPGFVHPQIMHEEGHFTQKAKQQIEELKKRLDKPTIENSEKKE
ncbi:unnamed protein product [Euphydryas editha]|uniref:Mitochondrial ATPase inhibitor n=1 Tax=Euphydryas editha TaxID=104508 RepID=A0AAU9TM42_EUPED|nr:unnamed protein product [Euphydryas editha]